MKPPVVFVLTHESNPQRTNKSTSIISLALTRSLGRRGIAVVRVHPNHLDRSLLSRYCKRVELCPNLYESEDGLVEFLLAMAARYAGPRVLLPASDDCAYFLAKHFEKLRGLYAIVGPSWQTMQRIIDKKSQYELAQALALPVPETYYPSSVAQVQELATRAAEQLAQIQSATPNETTQSVRTEVTQQEGASGGESNEGWTTSESRESPTNEVIDPESDSVIQLRTFAVKKLDLPRERRARRAAGKRTSTKSETKRGRYVRSSQAEKVTDVAFDATVRAAAPHQLSRRQAAPDATNQLQLESQDLRQKVRERKTGNLIVFVVDASASMDAEQRMLATKGAILSLLRHAYVRRDKVALVAFSGRNARVVLRPTSSVDLAERRLERLSIGGTTPLTHGLMTGLKLIKTERLRDPHVYPLLVLISDGRGNISLFGEEPLLEAQRMAGQIKQEGVRAMVIDSTRDFGSQPGYPRNRVTSLYGAYAFNVCGDLAERLGGRYYGLFDLSQSSIVDSVQREMLRTGSA